MNDWLPDVLGSGFTQLTLPLTPNDDGPGCATLVRYDRQADPQAFPNPLPYRFVMLYVHGWNDYFYQAHVARSVDQTGGHFYAIDLRAYGRSIRSWQTPGWTDNLRSYDEDFHHAIRLLRREHPGLPFVLAGHSTGGIITSFWAHRHPGAIDALVLNSPWLALQGSAMVQAMASPLAAAISTTYDPRQVIPTPGNDFHHLCITGYRAVGESIPPGEEDDPYWQEGGWNPDPVWRNSETHPTRAGWIWAVLEAQNFVTSGMNIDCPILVLHSRKSYTDPTWDPECRNCDCVLDVTQIRESSIKLGQHVTVIGLEGAGHDVFISRRPVREKALNELQSWLNTYVR